MDVLEAIKGRRSIRRFKNAPLPASLFPAARGIAMRQFFRILVDVRSFPVDARRLAGHFLHLIQLFRRKHEPRRRVISIWHGDD
jgi:hypothetical protein